MKITKIEAAKRQLNVAIHLYFHDMDLVSAHSLTGAARNIVFDLGKKFDIKQSPIDIIKSSYRESYETHIRSAQNFFKHAGGYMDEKKTFEFTEDTTEDLLYDALSRYFAITKELSYHMKIFNSYYYLKNKNNIENDNIKKIISQLQKQFKHLPSKGEFYRKLVGGED